MQDLGGELFIIKDEFLFILRYSFYINFIFSYPVYFFLKDILLSRKFIEIVFELLKEFAHSDAFNFALV
jgi:hypothetical protein